MIACIPNVSEGRRAEVIDALVQSVRPAGVFVLDRSSDPDHNRSVLTMAGSAGALRLAVLALVGCAVETIDLRVHRGVHPRFGAVDVVPFVPLDDAMEPCVTLARETGAAIARDFGVPVYLYGEAASTPARRALDAVRRGQFEGLAVKMSDPAWAPDFGPAVPHPTAGAVAVGARRALIAFNVNLASDRLDVARAIAARIRERGGGLPSVKALGLPLASARMVQVSMNLTDYERTAPAEAFAAVVREARAHGVAVAGSEVVGLMPRAALRGTTPEALQLHGFTEDRFLENRLAAHVRPDAAGPPR